jgi:galactose mutarotase-like enzyme
MSGSGSETGGMNMNYEISNAYVKVGISSKGGEIFSLQDNEGHEYIWQGDPETWAEHAPNLFPYIGRMTKGSYRVFGQEYQMKIHGFLKYLEMTVAEQKKDSLVLRLEDSEATRAQYPYQFAVEIRYTLDQSSLKISYFVQNKDDKKMYFGIGGHPGFQVPMEEGLAFEDYSLDFEEPSKPLRVEFSDDCFVTEKDLAYSLREDLYLDLRHDLFDQDAIVLHEMPRQVTLGSKKGKRAVRVEYPQMPYVGFWHCPKTEVPYVCIEPWSSLPSRKDRVEDLETQENLLALDAGSRYENSWKITVISGEK